MKKFPILVLFSLILTTPSMASEQLDAVNNQFTYQGNPIHPLLIEEFSNWFSDNRPPMITSVDIAAASDTNKYSKSEVVQNKNGWISVHKEDGSSFEYKWLGRMDNGLHIVEAVSSGGGSGQFTELYFTKFYEEESIWEADTKYTRLIMSVERVYSLGDRYNGEIKILTDKVLIPKSSNVYNEQTIDKDIELTFPKK